MAETAQDILMRMWRCLRNNCAEDQKARFYGAATALQQIGAINQEQLELWIRRIETCPGHDDEGGRAWCAYCGSSTCRVCMEHELVLNEDGTCPDCRDEFGQPFVLDMQSYFLVPKSEIKNYQVSPP